MKTTYNKNEEPIVVSKALLDLLLGQDKPADLIALYVFYYYTAKWQGTNQVRATVAYVCGGLKWSQRRTRFTRKQLTQLGLIEDLWNRDEATGRVKGTYVKVNFLWSRQSIESGLKHPENVQGGDSPQGGEPQAKCLRKTNKENASGGQASAGKPSGRPDEPFSDQEPESRPSAAPDAPPESEDGSLAEYNRRRMQVYQEQFFQQHFTEAQRLLSNGQLLERQPLSEDESASLAIDLYDYRCSVHGLDQEDEKEERYFNDADQRQFKKLAEEAATARFSVVTAVIAYLKLDTKYLPPGQADAHEQLRTLVWNGKQLRDNWTLAIVAIREFLATLPPLEAQTTKG